MKEDIVERCRRVATQGMESFLHILSFVPKDKLTWSPAPTAKSAIQIASHCAAYSGAFASVLREGVFPPSVEAFLGPIEARMEQISTVDDAEAMLRAGIAETLAALDGVTAERIGSVIDTPIGPTPFLFFMTIPANHLLGHAGQLDYLQTCWGDLEVHF
jgi:hypothetical protein